MLDLPSDFRSRTWFFEYREGAGFPVPATSNEQVDGDDPFVDHGDKHIDDSDSFVDAGNERLADADALNEVGDSLVEVIDTPIDDHDQRIDTPKAR